MSGRAVISFLLIGLLAQCCYAKSIFKATEEVSSVEATDNPNSFQEVKSSEESVSFEQVDPPEEVFTTEQNEAVTEQEGSTEEAVISDEDESINEEVLSKINESTEETTFPAAEEEGGEEESNTTESEQEDSSEKSEPNGQTESTEETTSPAVEEEIEEEESNTTESEQEEPLEESEPNEQTESTEETTSPAAEEEGEKEESNATESEQEEPSEESEPNEQTESTEETTSAAAEEEGEEEEEPNTTESGQEESSEKSDEQTELTESEEQVPGSESIEVLQLTAAYYIPNVTATLSEGQRILKALVKELEPTTGEYENLESWFYRDYLASYDRKIYQLNNAVKKSYFEDVNLIIDIFAELLNYPDDDMYYRYETDMLIRDAIKETNFIDVLRDSDIAVNNVFFAFDDKFNKYWNSLSPSQQKFQKPVYELYQIFQREYDFIKKMKIFKALNTL